MDDVEIDNGCFGSTMKNITCHPEVQCDSLMMLRGSLRSHLQPSLKLWPAGSMTKKALPRRIIKKYYICVLGIFLLVGCVPSESDTGSVRVLHVIDGDTIITTVGTVRLIGIDAPEKDECGYIEATEKLRELVDNKDVMLIPDSLNETKDKYGRLLRYIEIYGKDIGEVLLKEGYSDLYPWFPFERLEQYRSIDVLRYDRCTRRSKLFPLPAGGD